VTRRVEKRGVKLILNDSVENIEPKNGYIVTREGVSIAADLVVSYGFKLPLVNILQRVYRYPPSAHAQTLNSSRSLSDQTSSPVRAMSKSNLHSNSSSTLVCLP
jgi:phytoene dehydrogenase-like protein